jgi:SAM-dependent methyltransferase
VLDAGSGNGYFSWLAYRSGARVVAMNMEASQVEKSRDFLIRYRKADPSRLRFEQCNLYDLHNETRTFDEIICFETLEHIRRDDIVVKEFWRLLRPGGVLHICCPYRLHPRHQTEILDTDESGGHVRAGYTEDDYRRLLEPIGFKIELVAGLGPPSVYRLDALLRAIRNQAGDIFALPFLPFGLLAVSAARLDPPVPFSLYAKAVKAPAAE